MAGLFPTALVLDILGSIKFLPVSFLLFKMQPIEILKSPIVSHYISVEQR